MSKYLNDKRDADHQAVPEGKQFYNQVCRECGNPINYGHVDGSWHHGYPQGESISCPDALLVSAGFESLRHYSLPANKTTSLCRKVRDGIIEPDSWAHTSVCKHCKRMKSKKVPTNIKSETDV